MTEYIERKIALSIREPSKSDRHYQTYNLDDAYEQGWDDALCCIESIPVADVEPVRHGRWKLVGADRRGRGGEWKCDGRDGCGKLYPHKCYFCPNCGAKMDEVSE